MKTKNILKSVVGCVVASAALASCNVDPEFYTQVTPETFYTSQEAVYQRYARPFTHWRWYAGQSEDLWRLQELGTDEFMLPTRGSDWFDGGNYRSSTTTSTPTTWHVSLRDGNCRRWEQPLRGMRLKILRM